MDVVSYLLQRPHHQKNKGVPYELREKLFFLLVPNLFLHHNHQNEQSITPPILVRPLEELLGKKILVFKS